MNIEFKGTPGPWEVDGVEIRASASHPTERICEMAPGFSAEDAKLIAAAPDLLKALGDLLNTFDNLMGTTAARGQLYVAAAEAIAKATGNQP